MISIMERLCLFMSKPLTANLNIDASIDKFRIPKDVVEDFEKSHSKIQKIITKSKLKMPMHMHIEERNKEDLEKQKFISSLRKVLSPKEFRRLYGKLTEKQRDINVPNPSTAEEQLAAIEKIIKNKTGLSLEDHITGPIPVRNSKEGEEKEKEEELYTFSEKEKKDAKKFYEKVNKLLDNYDKKNKIGQSRTIVYDQDFIENNLAPKISEDSEKVIVISDYYSGTKGSTKIRKAANEVIGYIEKYNYMEIPNISKDEIKNKYKDDIIISLPKEVKAKTYLEALRKILEFNKNQYEKTYNKLSGVKKKFKRVDKNNLRLSLKDRIETVRKYKNILKDFIPMLKEFIAENPKHSKVLKSKATELINQYEGEADLWTFLDSYEKITYDIKYDKNNKDYSTILLSNRDLDIYYRHINNLIVTAIKAKSIHEVFDCICILDKARNSCENMFNKLDDIEKNVVKTNYLTDDEMMNYQKKLNNLAKLMSKNIDSLQRNMDKLKKFYETYKKENTLYSKMSKKALNILQMVVLFTRILSDFSTIGTSIVKFNVSTNTTNITNQTS